jgi:zinc protease
MKLFLLFWIFPLAALAAPDAADPSANITAFRLHNGVRVVFAPSDSATTTKLEVRVGVGQWSEEPGKEGVAHLLEHYLFKDARVKGNATFLELIRENGGEVNGSTGVRDTEFSATVPPEKTAWIVDIFGRLLLHREFLEADIPLARGPVQLEIGPPSPMDYFNYVVYRATHSFVHKGDFYESEFGIRLPNQLPTLDKIVTPFLTAADLKHFYNTYYHAGNFTVFVAGKFMPSEMRSLLEASIGQAPSGPRNGWEDPPAVEMFSPYHHSEAADGTPYLEVGTKYFHPTFEQELATRIYLGHLAHRLMKEIRNGKGETYTVSPHSHFYEGYGYATIDMESSAGQFANNLARVKALIQTEAREGNISAADFAEAMKLFEKSFHLTDRDSGTLMALAHRKQLMTEHYAGIDPALTPYRVFRSFTLESYKAAVKRSFDSRLSMESLTEPPVLFRRESMVLDLLSVAVWMWAIRLLFSARFRHDQVRWVRKLRYPPAYVLQAGVLFVAYVAFTFERLVTAWGWDAIGLANRPFVISQYLYGIFDTLTLLVTLQLVLGFTARKVMVVGGELWIKSLGYHSRRVPIESVQSVELVRVWRLYANPRLFYATRFRVCCFDPLFWRNGLLVTLKDGRAYYLAVTRPEAALAELRSLMPAEKTETFETLRAA